MASALVDTVVGNVAGMSVDPTAVPVVWNSESVDKVEGPGGRKKRKNTPAAIAATSPRATQPLNQSRRAGAGAAGGRYRAGGGGGPWGGYQLPSEAIHQPGGWAGAAGTGLVATECVPKAGRAGSSERT